MNISFLNIPAETPDEPVTEYLSQFPDMVGNALHIQKDHVGIPYYTGTQVYQVNRLYQHLPRYINDMLGRSGLCIYNNQLTDQSRERNNTNRSHYHRERTTDRYSTQTKEIPITTTNQIPKVKTNNNNKNQIQQPQTKLSRKTTPKSENYNHKKQQIHTNNRKMLLLEELKLHQQHNTILTKNHH